MGDFKMCVDASQSTSEHSIMDDPEQLASDSLAMEVLTLDVWTWLHGNDPGFTFQSAQHRETWSRLDRMYVMHNDSFLPSSLNMKVLHDVATSDHFPICLEVCNHGIDMYKSLLGKPPLRFNSTLLLQPHFDSLMEQILVDFSKEVNLKGVKAWAM